LVYLTELDDLFREGNSNLSVLELEPETFWEKIHRGSAVDAFIYLPNTEAMARVAALPSKSWSIASGSQWADPSAITATILIRLWML
jgi:hypothetical protein